MEDLFFAQKENEAKRVVNISETKEDISKRKTPFFCILKGLSNKQKLFFTSYAL